MSGWKLKDAYRDFDAELKFQVQDIQTRESEICIAGQILQGLKKPSSARLSVNHARRKIRWEPPWYLRRRLRAYYRYARIDHE
jgi:hydrogenase expression/formation protein HypD